MKDLNECGPATIEDCEPFGDPPPDDTPPLGDEDAPIELWKPGHKKPPPKSEAPPSFSIRPVGDTDWLDTDPPPVSTVFTRTDVDGHDAPFLPMGTVGFLAAAGGTGKTVLVIQAGVAVATGTNWLDRFHAENRANPDPEPGAPVLLIRS